MNCEAEEEIVLIVDDDDTFRETHGPRIAREVLGEDIEVRTAANASDAMRVLRDLAMRNERLALALIDMHMPLFPGHPSKSQEAGNLLLNVLKDRFFSSSGGRAIVYTAYPSLANCVAAMQAGAADYVPKVNPDPTVPQGPQYLIERCKALLAPTQEGTPSREWEQWNMAWLQDTFAGKWVGFVPEAVGKQCGLDGEIRDGVMLLAYKDYYDLVGVLIAHEALLLEPPNTWHIPDIPDDGREE